MNAKTFGEFFKELRIRQGVTLREFCAITHQDPGNISKMERDLLPPPQDVQKLKQLAGSLGVKEGSDDWHAFVDLASAGSGRIPPDIMSDDALVSRLPVLFRTARRKKLTREVLEQLIAKLRKA